MRYGIKGFQPQRLQQLRMSFAMTQEELAKALQCSKGNISKWEQGKSSPESESFKKICSIFEVSETWLLEAPVASGLTQPSFFRAQNATPKVSREIAKVRLDWAEEISYKLQESLDFPKINLPVFSGDFKSLADHEIEDMASKCRDLWQLGQSPIDNIINIMESNGVVITKGWLGFSKMDGVSRWSQVDHRPYVFLCRDKSNGFRTRFDSAHEMGHIVLHKHVSDVDYKKYYHLLESQAHRFASALLLPAASFSRDIKWPSLEGFLALKGKWKVSAAAMIHRCQDLELISREAASKLWKARSARGWVQREPNDDILSVEDPKLLNRSINMLIANNILNKNMLRNMIGIPTNIIEDLCSLPENYFTDGHEDKVIELRLKSKIPRNYDVSSHSRKENNVLLFKKK